MPCVLAMTSLIIFAPLLQRLRAGRCHTYTFARRDTVLEDNVRWVVGWGQPSNSIGSVV
jgi:hypothetical protein